MRQYRVENGKPLPFQSDPGAAYRVCMQKTCSQLYQHRLWKCPALAYFSLMEKKLRIEGIPEWQLFRDYQVWKVYADKSPKIDDICQTLRISR